MQSKYVEAIGILEELLRIKKINFGINSKDVRKNNFHQLSSIIVHEILQATMRNLQYFSSLLLEEGGC